MAAIHSSSTIQLSNPKRCHLKRERKHEKTALSSVLRHVFKKRRTRTTHTHTLSILNLNPKLGGNSTWQFAYDTPGDAKNVICLYHKHMRLQPVCHAVQHSEQRTTIFSIPWNFLSLTTKSSAAHLVGYSWYSRLWREVCALLAHHDTTKDPNKYNWLLEIAWMSVLKRHTSKTSFDVLNKGSNLSRFRNVLCLLPHRT